MKAATLTLLKINDAEQGAILTCLARMHLDQHRYSEMEMWQPLYNPHLALGFRAFSAHMSGGRGSFFDSFSDQLSRQIWQFKALFVFF